MKALLIIACSIICLSLGCASTSMLWTDENLYSYPYDCTDYPSGCIDYTYPWYGSYPGDFWYGDPYNYYYPYYPYDPDHECYYIYYPYYPYYYWKDHPENDRVRYLREKRNQINQKITNQRKARKKAREERINSIQKSRQKAREQRINKIRQARQNRIDLRRARTERFRSTFQRSTPRSFFRASPNVFRRR